jgi:hypothetical protein
MEWPKFEKQPLDNGRTWDARVDVYDQYHENCYYYVRVNEGDNLVADFFVQIGMEWAPDDQSGPEFLEELRSRIASVAATGQTNTTHVGRTSGP